MQSLEERIVDKRICSGMVVGSDLFPAKKQMHDIISLQLFYSLAFCELDQHLLGDVNLKILCESPESPVNGRYPVVSPTTRSPMSQVDSPTS